MKTKATTVLGIVITLATITTMVFKLDGRFAKANDVESLREGVEYSIRKVGYRLDIKILKDRLEAIQERLWKLQDRFGYKIEEMPIEIREQYRKLEQEMRDLEKEIEDIVSELRKKGDTNGE